LLRAGGFGGDPLQRKTRESFILGAVGPVSLQRNEE
jgi:hypothetical protein